MESSAILISLVGGVFALALGSLVGAVLLRAAAKWVMKEDVAFGNAFVTVLLASIANFAVGFGIGALTGVAMGPSEEAGLVAQIISLPVGFLIYAAIVNSRLRTRSFGQACLVTLVVSLIAFGIAAMVGVIVFVATR